MTESMTAKAAAEIVDRMSGGSIPTEATMRTAYAALCKSKAAWAISKADKLEQLAPQYGVEL
jgi:hypothetical protein